MPEGGGLPADGLGGRGAGRGRLDALDPMFTRFLRDTQGMRIPDRDSDRPQDDPWDADAVRFLLSRPEGATWNLSDLSECLRRQLGRRMHKASDIRRAADLATKYGVEQIEEPFGKTTVVRLYRSDADAPPYPLDAPHRRQLLEEQTAEKAAAEEAATAAEAAAAAPVEDAVDAPEAPAES
jgi:hypothetical protein